MTAEGTITATQCTITLNGEGLTITSANGQKWKAKLPAETI